MDNIYKLELNSNLESEDFNHSLDKIIEILQLQVNNLKNKLKEEREEHRAIYKQIKDENDYLKEQINNFK
tara:strand:- start:2332 stop:2541 length:210 start_codon:yes stop_codon:yes gene_type:complete